MVNVTSSWSATDYAANAAFVPELGEPALALLNPQSGELILDLGCGDGVLTERIVAAGARAIGIDSSVEMIEAARRRGIDAFVGDAETLDLERQAERFGRFDGYTKVTVNVSTGSNTSVVLFGGLWANGDTWMQIDDVAAVAQ